LQRECRENGLFSAEDKRAEKPQRKNYVAKINFASQSGELATGTQMLWRTESVVAPAAEANTPQLSTPMGLR
jgi:hypothetical protein